MKIYIMRRFAPTSSLLFPLCFPTYTSSLPCVFSIDMSWELERCTPSMSSASEVLMHLPLLRPSPCPQRNLVVFCGVGIVSDEVWWDLLSRLWVGALMGVEGGLWWLCILAGLI